LRGDDSEPVYYLFAVGKKIVNRLLERFLFKSVHKLDCLARNDASCHCAPSKAIQPRAPMRVKD